MLDAFDDGLVPFMCSLSDLMECYLVLFNVHVVEATSLHFGSSLKPMIYRTPCHRPVADSEGVPRTLHARQKSMHV